MAFKLPPLNALRIFEVAARHSSFKGASDELHVTASAVSHAVQTLEGWLGAQLFDRAGRNLKLTEAGKSYAPYVREALETLAEATQRLPGRHATGALSISCAPTFAARWLLPRLNKFGELHPEIRLSIDTSTRLVDLPADGVDIAIRMGFEARATSNWTRLLSETLIPVCSPALAARVRKLPAKEILNQLPLIHVTTVSTDWKEWYRAAGYPVLDRFEGGLRVDTVHMAMDAAAQGLGIALGRPPFVNEDLRAGRLAIAIDHEVTSGLDYWLIVTDKNIEKPEVKAFRRWITATLPGHAASSQDKPPQAKIRA